MLGIREETLPRTRSLPAAWRRKRGKRAGGLAILAALAWLAGGCRGGGTPGEPPRPIPGDPHQLVTRLLGTGDHPPRRDRIDFSSDDHWILYTSGPGSDVWRVAADGTSHPRVVTDPLTTDWLAADDSPTALAGERVAFYHGWYEGDHALHLLVSPVTADSGRAVALLHRFPSTAVGLTTGQASSPQVLSLAADGQRAVGYWHEAYRLDWADEDPRSPPTSHLLEGLDPAGGLALTRDGTLLAFVTEAGEVAWGRPDSLAAAEVLGPGRWPAWNGDGRRLAYLSSTGEVMLWDRDAGTLTPYRPSLPGPVVGLALSWAGDAVALLVRGDTDHQLYVGSLVAGNP